MPVAHEALVALDDSGVILGFTDDTQQAGVDPLTVPEAPDSPTPAVAEDQPGFPANDPLPLVAAVGTPSPEPSPEDPFIDVPDDGPDNEAAEDPRPATVPGGPMPEAAPPPAAAVPTRAQIFGVPEYDVSQDTKTTVKYAAAGMALLTVVGAGAIAASGPGMPGMILPPGVPARRRQKAKLTGVRASRLGSVSESEAWGDRSRTWRWPGTDRIDEGIKSAFTATSSYFAVIPRTLIDGSWARAMFGSLGLILWVAGAVLGVMALNETNWLAAPPSVPLTLAIVSLGILDAAAGAIAWIVVVLGVMLSGNYTGIEDLRTLLGLGVLYLGMGLLANAVRPLRREIGSDGKERFDRLADYVMVPVASVLAGAGVYLALNGLSGLELVSKSDVPALQITIVMGLWVRMLLEECATYLYPERSLAVAPPRHDGPSTPWKVAAIGVKLAVFLLVAQPFFGLGWPTWLAGLMIVGPMLIRLRSDKLPNSVKLNKWMPKGLFRMAIMLYVGAAWAILVLGSEPSDDRTRQTFALIALPAFILTLVDLVGREGWTWPDTWKKRIAGIAFWVFTTGVAFGLISIM